MQTDKIYLIDYENPNLDFKILDLGSRCKTCSKNHRVDNTALESHVHTSARGYREVKIQTQLAPLKKDLEVVYAIIADDVV